MPDDRDPFSNAGTQAESHPERPEQPPAERERLWRNFFELPMVGAAITSRTKGWVEVNDAACDILGYPREELLKKTWADVTHPDDLAADEAQFARMLRREIDGYQIEKRFIRKDGSVVHALLAGGCGPIGDRIPELFYVSMLDITRSKTLEGELDVARRQLEKVALEVTENIPVGTFTLVQAPGERVLRAVFVSTRFLRMTGLDREAVLADPLAFDALVHPDDHDAWVSTYTKALETKLPFRGECRIVVNDRTFWVACESVPRDRGDGSTVWEGVLADITDRKEAEEKLRLSEERHRLLADNAADVINVIGLDGKLLYVSPSVERLIGYTQDEVLELSVEDILMPEAAAGARAGLAQTAAAIAAGETTLPEFHGEFPHRHKDGSTVWAEATSTCMVDKDGTYIASLVVTRDISKRKKLEAELAAAREREKQAEEEMRVTLEKKLKTSLHAAAVAHEINQPLSRLLLRARLDLEKESGTGKETLEALIKDAERVVATIEKMKVLLRNVETTQQPVDVAQVVSSSLLQLKQPLRLNNITVRMSGPERSCTVIGDEVQLQMVLTNVIRNAIEAISQANAATREISIERIPHDGTVDIVIGDSGPGWPGGALDEMLLNTSKPEGTGVGLYIVQTAVENHRGQISIGRSPLGGAEFRIRLPRA